MSPETEALAKREAYFKSLAEVIVAWESDPKCYDLRLVAHELQKLTGSVEVNPSSLPPGEFIALLGRCKRRGANPPEPVPPKGAVHWRKELHEFALEKHNILLMERDLFFVPAQYRGAWPEGWEPVEAKHPGDAQSRALIFDRPLTMTQAGELLTIAAEMGTVPGSGGQRLWYRLYYKVKLPKMIDVQILAEGTTTTVGGARSAMSRKLKLFLQEQCECEPLPEEPEPEPRMQTYYVTVPVRMNAREATAVSKWTHQAELSTVVTSAVQRYAKQLQKLREERAAARRAQQAARAKATTNSDTTERENA